jgi:PAS domain S-box-containing protein
MPILNWLLNPSGLTAHGFCLSWAPGLVALHVISDAMTGLAYFSIAVALAVLVRRRGEPRFDWLAYLFSAFILACGATHLFSILTLWVPVYGLEGLVKLATAGLSVATAVALWPLIPKVLALPTAAQLERLNADLECRVQERTRDLVEANARMTQTLADLTRAQAALIRSEEQFRAIFEASPVGKTQTDPATGRIIRANPAFAHMLGCKPDDLVGLPFIDLIWTEDRDVHAGGGDGVGPSDCEVRDLRFFRVDGEPIWSRVSRTRVSASADGRPALSIAVIEDIDDRHKAKLALQQAKQVLEQVVEQRTAALAQRDLLIREVYHRVKNNLQIIDGLLVMQARNIADPEARQAFSSLRSRVYALGLVHHQLMDSEDLQTFDVAPFLKELTEHILEGGQQNAITLNVQSIPLNVGLDFALPLGLIVTELVTNSLKHAFPEGRGNIDVVLGRGDDGGVALVVSDDGVGLTAPPAGAPGRKSALGAGIIKGLVAQLRGTMAISSANGARTEIHLAAPVTA